MIKTSNYFFNKGEKNTKKEITLDVNNNYNIIKILKYLKNDKNLHYNYNINGKINKYIIILK